MNCECCHHPKDVSWYLVDDNAEVELCGECARGLREECKVKKIEVDS